MHSIRNLISLSTEYLEKKGVPHARRQAEELLAALLQRKRLDLYLDYDQPIEENEVAQYRSWIKRKGDGEPVEYITQKLEFLGCELEVSSAVLIPRKETEILVSMALKDISGGIVWDLCTGSGCIGLAVRKNCPEAKVTLSDISPQALAIAKRNAAHNDLDVSFREGDLLDPFQGEKADVIFCNPPYIPESDYAHLEREVKSFEPKLALVAKRDGYEFFERLSRDLPQFLNPGGRVYLEMGNDQGKKIADLFNESHWTKKICEKDWAGHDRFFFLEFHP